MSHRSEGRYWLAGMNGIYFQPVCHLTGASFLRSRDNAGLSLRHHWRLILIPEEVEMTGGLQDVSLVLSLGTGGHECLHLNQTPRAQCKPKNSHTMSACGVSEKHFM